MDDKEFVPLIDFIPIKVSDNFAECREKCRTQKERELWDMAIKECIKSVVLESPVGMEEQIHDLKWLMFEEWNWEEDERFVNESKRKRQQHKECYDDDAFFKVDKSATIPKLSDKARKQIKKADETRNRMWEKILGKVLG